MSRIIAGIDCHKKVLMVVVVEEGTATVVDKRRFGTTMTELNHLSAWLQEKHVKEVVMESTAQYWKPVWYALEKHFLLQLAQAWSSRAPRGLSLAQIGVGGVDMPAPAQTASYLKPGTAVSLLT